jgi:hypothetical protein
VFIVPVLGAVGLLAGLIVMSALAGVVSLVFWVVLLPFRLLGFVFRGLAFLLFLPFLLLLGGGLLFLVGLPLLLTVLVAAAPAVLFVLAIVWLAKKTMRRVAA